MSTTQPPGAADEGSMTRSVLITGGTGGLGAAVTDRFLKDGHNVVAASRLAGSSETLTGTLNHFEERLHLVQSDVTEPSSVAELVERTVARVGTSKVLIHLVGGWAGGRPLQDVSLETWERMCDLRSAFLCSRAVLPIIFVSSEGARSGGRNQGAYAVAKAGVALLAEAEENNDVDVTAHVVAPSALDTPADRAAPAGADPSSLVSVGAVAIMVAFLASVEAGQLRGAWLPAVGRA